MLVIMINFLQEQRGGHSNGWPLIFYSVSMGGVFLSVIAAGIQLCDGEEKRENETPLRYKSIPYLSGFFFLK